jgi:hypothetical protein
MLRRVFLGIAFKGLIKILKTRHLAQSLSSLFSIICGSPLQNIHNAGACLGAAHTGQGRPGRERWHVSFQRAFAPRNSTSGRDATQSVSRRSFRLRSCVAKTGTKVTAAPVMGFQTRPALQKLAEACASRTGSEQRLRASRRA